MDRSLIFTCLLDLSPEFRAMECRAGEQVTTRAVEAWRASDATDMHAWTKQWLLTETAKAALVAS